jgi:hypothetical protein
LTANKNGLPRFSENRNWIQVMKHIIIVIAVVLAFYIDTDAQILREESIDSLFLATELEKEKIKFINCTEIYFKIDDMLNPDTLVEIRYQIDSLYRIDNSTQNIRGLFARLDSSAYCCQYLYHENEYIKKCNQLTQSIVTTYENGKLASLKLSRKGPMKGNFWPLQYDTFIYNNGYIAKRITTLSNPESNMFVDTIFRYYSYDTLQRLTLYTINPPKFFHTVIKEHSGYNYDKAMQTYSYKDKETIIKRLFLRNDFKDTLVDLKEHKKLIVDDETFKCVKIESLIPQEGPRYYFTSEAMNNRTKIVSEGGDIKTRINKANSLLPAYITVNEGNGIRYVSFKYTSR